MDDTTQHFVIEKLLRELREIKEQLFVLADSLQKQTEAIRARDERDAHQQEPKRIRVDVRFEDSIVRERASYQDKQYRLQNSVKRATWCAFFAANIYAAVAYLQRNAMLDSNRINRDALESVQRAFISLGGIADGKVTTDPKDSSKMAEITFYFSWKNSGTTPGINARDWDNAITTKSEISKDFAFPDHIAGKDVPAGTGGGTHVMYYPPQAAANTGQLAFTRKEVEQFQNNRGHLYMYGWTKYNDIFKGTPQHVTMFWYEIYRIAVIPPTPSTPPPTNLSVSMRQCDRHNCVDETCKGEPGY